MSETADQREVERELGLIDYWRMLWKRKWLIAAICVLSVLATYLYAIRLPKLYTSSVTALMPREEVGFGGSRITLPGLGGAGGTGGTGGTEGFGGGWGNLLGAVGISMSASSPYSTAYLAYLNSRTMREEVVEHFKRSWGPSVVSLIAGVTSTVAQQDGILRITAESQDPKLSAELANYYLKHLEVLLARKGKRLKDLQHQFYASRLEPARQDLEEAQKTILAFQEKHRTLGLSAGTQAAVAGSAAGATSVIGLEMQRTLKRMYLTDRHPEMIALDRQIYEAKRLVSHSLWGEPGLLPPPPQEGPNAPPRKEYFVAAAKLTPLQWQAVDVLRTLQIRVGVHQMIATNLELAKYQSDVPPPQIEVVDPAIPPGGPSKPNVQTYVRTAALGSLVVGIFLAFFLEYLERVRGLERVARVDRRREHGLVPAPEMANGPLSAELFNGTSPESYADESASRFFDRRRSAAPVIREGPRLL